MVATDWRWNGRRPTDNGYELETTFGASGATGHEAEPTEFVRFEDLAGKLLQVPKAELDEKLARD